MADELLFDSERQEKRAERKRRLLPLLVLAGAILLAVVVALLLRSGRSEVHKVGEDGPYPFTWEQDSDGSLLLELPHRDDPAYSWVPEAGELPTEVLRAESKEKSNTTRLRLTPLQTGRSLIRLNLLQQTEQSPTVEAENKEDTEELRLSPTDFLAGGSDILYRYDVLLEAAEEENELRLQLLDAVGTQLQAKQTGGRDSENPYRVEANERQNLVLTVLNSSGSTDWSYEILSGQDSVQVLGIGYESGTVSLILGAGETPGPAELVFRSAASAVELKLLCSAQGDGSLLLTDHSAGYGEKPPAGSGEEAAREQSGQAGDGADQEPTEEETEYRSAQVQLPEEQPEISETP